MRQVLLIGGALVLLAGAAQAQSLPSDDAGDGVEAVQEGGDYSIDPPYPPSLYIEDDGAE